MRDKQPKTVRELNGLRLRFGGPDQVGWLPPNARPPNEGQTTIDLKITKTDHGFFLVATSSHPHFRGGDSWHRSLQEALEASAEEFGIRPEDWRSVSE